MKRISALAVMAFLFSSCASLPSIEKMARADYGSFPTDWKKNILSYLQQTMKDPDSAKMNLDDAGAIPNKFAFGHGTRFGIDDLNYGWCSQVRINGKNSYGGYTGYSPWVFCWRNEILDPTISGDLAEIPVSSFFRSVEGRGVQLDADWKLARERRIDAALRH